ncbi:MAG: hypothetical protein HC845_06555 [Akkermansiaceae bacterium]|nr:hypothetical protein [Akkermansiaceae bacterium]
MIDAAPEASELPPAPEPPPWKEEAHAAAEPKKELTPAVEDVFYNDPLIQAALVKFEGKVVG